MHDSPLGEIIRPIPIEGVLADESIVAATINLLVQDEIDSVGASEENGTPG